MNIEENNKGNKKRVLRGWVYIFFLVICIFILLSFLFKVIDSSSINNKLNKKYVKITDNEISIDFSKVKKYNKEVVGYIKVDGTNIKHFVVKGKNNNYYLDHDLKKRDRSSGWVFMDSNNKMDGTDKNLVIYGKYNRKLFKSLKNVLKKDWQKNNNYVTLVTKDGNYKYQVISTYKTSEKLNYIFDQQTDYLKFVNSFISMSNYNYNVSVESIDSIITLVAIDGNKKIVLHAKRVN